jgi:hypothetical protein
MKRLILLLLPLAFVACKGDKASPQSAEEMAQPSKVESASKYKLTPFDASTEYQDAKIVDMTYKAGKFDFEVANYELGIQTPDAASKMCANSGKGQHIHLIVNNSPYAAKYEASFDYDLPDGEHYLCAFLSRSYHESIKTEAASVIQKIVVADKGITAAEDVKDPMIFYSRPKGTYVGDDTKKVMLDWYLANVDMDKHDVQADINGEKHILPTWQPYYIEGLPMGENKITLQLVDKSGKPVAAPQSPVTRVFTLKPDLTPEK